MLTSSEWQPSYQSTDAFLAACQSSDDPLRIRSVQGISYHFMNVSECCYSEALHIDRINEILRQFPKWREERLPPPRVSQSEVRSSPLPDNQYPHHHLYSTIKLG